MSEEEAIDILKNNEVLQALFNIKYVYKIKQAIETILDLYQEEKEKNIELQNADLTTVYMNGFYAGEKKYKNKIKHKIKDKIKELEENVKDFEATDNTGRFKKEKSIDYYKLEALKELLEEE